MSNVCFLFFLFRYLLNRECMINHGDVCVCGLREILGSLFTKLVFAVLSRCLVVSLLSIHQWIYVFLPVCLVSSLHIP